MNEKRFTYDKPLVAFSKGGINDNVTGETYEFTMDTVLDLLNGQQKIINELGETNEILLDNLNKELNSNHQSSQSFINERTKDKDEIIEDLRAEDKRLNDVIINLHNELRQNDKKVKKQHMIINIQWDIIACLMELKGVIEDE